MATRERRPLRKNNDSEKESINDDVGFEVELIKQVLADDRRIRDLTSPWMAQLSKLISSNGTQRRLANAYGVY